MPTKNFPATLPDAAAKLWIKAFNSAYEGECQGDDEGSAKRAWGAVQSSYRRDENGWVAKSELVPLELYITKASLDPETGEMRWSAVASDTREDNLRDEMSKRLFDSFLHRIKSNAEVPERWQTDFWKGGLPYLSVSHYSGRGDLVSGMAETVFLDGDRLKARGTFTATAIGRASFDAVRDSIKKTKSGVADHRPVRISIGFLDYAHKHKGSGFEFVRKSLEDVCLECLREKLGIIQRSGVIYQDGHLLHLALTRVPINEGTSIEVNRSMPTMKEDAASIVGEDLAEDLDEIEKELIKEAKQSRALVTKSEGGEVTSTETVPATETSGFVQVGDAPTIIPPGETVSNVSNGEYITVVAGTPLTPAPHVLDSAFAEFKSAFDGYNSAESASPEMIQKALNKLAETANAQIRKGTPAPEPQPIDVAKVVQDAVEQAVKRATLEFEAKLSMALEKRSQPAPAEAAPVQRSIVAPPVVVINDPAQHKSKVAAPKLSSISQMMNRSVGLPPDTIRPGVTFEQETG